MNGHANQAKELFQRADSLQQNSRTVPPTGCPRRTRLRPQPAPPQIPNPHTAGGLTSHAALGNRPPGQLAAGRPVFLAGRGLHPPPFLLARVKLPLRGSRLSAASFDSPVGRV